MKLRFSLRILLLLITGLGIAFAFDQYAESNADAFKSQLHRNPRRFVYRSNKIPGEITVKLDGIRDQTTLADRLLGRRSLTVFYCATVENESYVSEVQGTERFVTYLNSTRKLRSP